MDLLVPQVRAARNGTGADRYHDLRRGHGGIGLLQCHAHVLRHRARDQQTVGVARRCDILDAKSPEIEHQRAEHVHVRFTPVAAARADLTKLERIIRHSSERYFDTETGRTIVVGRHDRRLLMIPYEVEGETITPVTVHAITRQQIRFRLRTGRFTHE